ncbi:MAG: Procyclic acidic repetitive protein (PARP) [Phormidium sp. OSCR]|nr:MAG: Procyclic acidic repetitive protein (PARP) [Phormidium sp. OSCR]
MLDGREGNNTLLLSTTVAVDLDNEDDQTVNDEVTVTNFNNVEGSFGNDTMLGNENPNQLFGRFGNDVLVGGGNVNTLSGGEGDDLIVASTQDIVSGGNGQDTLRIDGDEDTTIQLPDDIEVLITGAGNDSLTGTPGQDTLISTGGNNTLVGNGGGDFFSGGFTEDVIVGGSGADSLIFNDPGEGVDTVTSLFASEDRILVSAAGFGGGLTPGSIAPTQLAFGSSAFSPDHRFIFEFITTLNADLHYDPDGNGPDSQITLLNFNNVSISDIDTSSIIVF